MKKLIFPAITIALMSFTACNNSGSESTETTTEQPATPAPQTVSPDVNPPHGEPGHVHENATEGIQLEATPGAGAQTTPQGDVKLNPPHGEPGHRCDIPVGSPL